MSTSQGSVAKFGYLLEHLLMKKKNFSFANPQNNGYKPKTSNINIKPIYEVANFTPIRRPINPSRNFELCLFDLLPPNINLTANELKVLIVLRAMVVGNSNLAAIDQEQIFVITGVQQPNVARAIAGLRKKGIILETWMEEGSQRYRNIYALWTPPKQAQQDAKKMLSQQKRVKKLQEQANNCDPKSSNKAEKLRKQAQQEKEKICISCKGVGWMDVYLRDLDKDSGKLCVCSLGIYLSKQYSIAFNKLIPDDILKELLNQK
jgi:hypothetical protein